MAVGGMAFVETMVHSAVDADRGIGGGRDHARLMIWYTRSTTPGWGTLREVAACRRTLFPGMRASPGL